jgi:hypothetical protein
MKRTDGPFEDWDDWDRKDSDQSHVPRLSRAALGEASAVFGIVS